MVTGDAARLHQVLTNLLANARVHTGAGTVVTTRLSTEPAHTVLQVIDNGPGIPAELQSEVFERFARGDSSRSRKGGSTGLGLAIVSAVVKAHNGTISVNSSPGHTEFTVQLPQRMATARVGVGQLLQVTSISNGLLTGCSGLAMSTPVAVPVIL